MMCRHPVRGHSDERAEVVGIFALGPRWGGNEDTSNVSHVRLGKQLRGGRGTTPAHLGGSKALLALLRLLVI